MTAAPPLKTPGEEPERGLSCPDCGCAHVPVKYTRDLPGGRRVRVRECRNCGRRIRTTERLS